MTPDQARQALKDRRDALLAEDVIDSEARKPVALDQESVGRLSRMDALQLQAMAKALEARRAAERRRIDAALKRLDEMEWGYCLECGEDIAAKRLEHDPSVTHCIGCAT